MRARENATDVKPSHTVDSIDPISTVLALSFGLKKLQSLLDAATGETTT